jgi:hypothetical protein
MSACQNAGVAPATPEELKIIQDGRKVAVLFRFFEQGREHTPAGPAWVKRISLSIGDYESFGVPTELMTENIMYKYGAKYRARYLSADALANGWVILFLAPGYYYVAVHTIETDGGEPCGGPLWRLEIPSGAPVVYVGSFSLSGVESGGLGMRWLRLLYPDATHIEDQSNIAVEVSRHEFPSLPPPVTRLAVSHSGTFLLGIPDSAAHPLPARYGKPE